MAKIFRREWTGRRELAMARRRIRQPGLAAKVPLPAQEGIDTAMSNQRQTPASYANLLFHVYADVGDEDNLISVTQFATRAEGKAWMDQ